MSLNKVVCWLKLAIVLAFKLLCRNRRRDAVAAGIDEAGDGGCMDVIIGFFINEKT